MLGIHRETITSSPGTIPMLGAMPALAAAFPSLPLYLSSAVNPQMEEYPRANTTALAAYVGLVVDRYLGDVEAKMAEVGARCALRLMRSDGGVATPRAYGYFGLDAPGRDSRLW